MYMGSSYITLNYDLSSSYGNIAMSGTWSGTFTVDFESPNNANDMSINVYSATQVIPTLICNGKVRYNNNYNFTIGTLQIEAGKTFTFRYSYTLYITNIVSNGTGVSEANLQSTSAGTAFTLSKANGTVRPSEIAIKDCAATGGAQFRAIDSTNVSGNSGWEFISENDTTVSAKAKIVALGIQRPPQPRLISPYPRQSKRQAL
jgi:hypothetical protein